MTIYQPPSYLHDYLASGRRKTIFVKKNAKTLQRIDFESVSYLAADGAYTDVHFRDGTRCTLDMGICLAIKEFHRNDLLQIHRSFAVPFHAIQSVRCGELVLINGRELPIGRVYRSGLQEALVG